MTSPLVIPTTHPIAGVAFNATMTTQTQCTIYAGQSTSGAIDMTVPERLGYLPLLVATPTAWDAAKLTLQASYDNVVWLTLYRWFDNKSFTTDHTVTANMAVLFDGYPLRGCPYFRFISGTDAAPVVQTVTRILKVTCGTY